MARSTFMAAYFGRSTERASADDSDGALLDRAGRGDERACRALIERHGERLYWIVERSHGDLQASEDIVQEAFIKAIDRAPQLRESEALFPWIVRIALRVALDHRRKTRRERPMSEPPESGWREHPPDPEVSVREAQLRRDVRVALYRLPAYPRELLTLRYFASFSVAELARVYAKSQVAIRKDLQRSRRRLERHLGAWFEEGS